MGQQQKEKRAKKNSLQHKTKQVVATKYVQPDHALPNKASKNSNPWQLNGAKAISLKQRVLPKVTMASKLLLSSTNQKKQTQQIKRAKIVKKAKPKKKSSHYQNGKTKQNKNIEAVNKVSIELQQWLRTEIKKLNAEVEAVSVAHLLLTLDDETAKTTAYHTFGSSKEVNTFIDSFLMHRSHDLQQQKNQKHAAANAVASSQSSSNKKKKSKKSNRR